ncbi:MAG TPA: M14 family zinc carboxypeptidase, partial [Thermoanaerobaculia bacterium]|nr:M14 family zinc carboxypeptidase [Thermoanaerobaculia bacterium]
AFSVASALPPAAQAPSAEALSAAWTTARVSPPSGSYAPEALVADLESLVSRSGGLVTVAERGASAEGRPILVLAAGTGPEKVLLWSQMHGDEPTATCALVDLLSQLVATRAEPATEQLLARLTLLVLPMLNPDGAARNDRRNAQGIDINRDAVELQTPEARFLKAVRDRHAPGTGFNLHNQGALVTAGPTGPQSALAVLAVPGAEREPDGPAVARKKGLGTVMARAAEPFGPGRVARYDMSYTQRAFGDSMSRWGTPTVLLETGGWDGPGEAERLVRLNFVVLLSALHALARGEEALAAPAYETLPFNARGRLVDLILRDATVQGGRELPPFHADVAFVRPRAFAGEGQRLAATIVTGVGDLNHLRGLTEVDATGLVVAPAPPGGASAWDKTLAGLVARGLAKGDSLLLDDGTLAREVRAWAAGGVVTPWTSVDLVLLRRSEKGLVVDGFVRDGVRGK